MEFRPPKVKGKFRTEHLNSYPASLKNVANYCGANAVIGKYNGSNVVVDDPESTLALYNLGCFGKGSLSRNEPNYSLRMSGTMNNVCSVEKEKDINEERISNITENNSGVSVEPEHLSHSHDCEETDNDDKICLPANEEEFKLTETLHLNLEEAYFLCYGLGCLQVVDLFDKKLSLLEAWELFCESQDDFVQKYVVYHYYRTKGWVVKPGLKFGGDFVIYKFGVHITHASYIVIIEVIREDGNISDDHQQAFTWTKFISLNRMAETAGKEVILCRVVWPQDILFKDVQSPEDLRKFSIEEILTKRWVSSQERELLDKEEIE